MRPRRLIVILGTTLVFIVGEISLSYAQQKGMGPASFATAPSSGYGCFGAAASCRRRALVSVKTAIAESSPSP